MWRGGEEKPHLSTNNPQEHTTVTAPRLAYGTRVRVSVPALTCDRITLPAETCYGTVTRLANCPVTGPSCLVLCDDGTEIDTAAEWVSPVS